MLNSRGTIKTSKAILEDALSRNASKQDENPEAFSIAKNYLTLVSNLESTLTDKDLKNNEEVLDTNKIIAEAARIGLTLESETVDQKIIETAYNALRDRLNHHVAAVSGGHLHSTNLKEQGKLFGSAQTLKRVLSSVQSPKESDDFTRLFSRGPTSPISPKGELDDTKSKLENINKVAEQVGRSRVNFSRKGVSVFFYPNTQETKILSEIIKIGNKPPELIKFVNRGDTTAKKKMIGDLIEIKESPLDNKLNPKLANLKTESLKEAVGQEFTDKLKLKPR